MVYALIKFTEEEKSYLRILICERLENIELDVNNKLKQDISQKEREFYLDILPKRKAFAKKMVLDLEKPLLPLSESELNILRSWNGGYNTGVYLHDTVLNKLDMPLLNDKSMDGGSIFEETEDAE